MHGARAICLGLLLVMVWPAAARADDVDVPELGVRLTSLPRGAVKPQVVPKAGGYELTTGVGEAVLRV